MRLRSCIALELGCAIAIVLGAGWFVRAAFHAFGDQPAVAATRGVARTVEPLPRAILAVPVVAGAHGAFDRDDETLLQPLGATPVVKLRLNRGGTSLSLRLDFASGARAAFKPQQIHPQSDPRREIAAYRIDRLLGIGRVPPAKPATFAVADLIATADPAFRAEAIARFSQEAIAKDGVVHGQVSWWIPELRDAKIGQFRIDEPQGMFQWSTYLQVGAKIPPEMHGLVTQIATMIVFDVVIDNADRWTGNNTKSAPDQRTLYFMDNTLSFSTFTVGHEANLAQLRHIQVFPRALIQRLRGLTVASLEVALDVGDDPLAPLLQPAEIHAVLARRDYILKYVDALASQFGEAAVFAL